MKKTKTIKFVESFIILPVMTVLMPFGGAPNTGATSISLNNPQVQVAEVAANQDATFKLEADAIDTYFKAHDMPLAGMGMKMVKEADANDLDWRLIAAIAVRESTGGKNTCDRVKFNPFGWGSCKIGFKSYDEAIEVVARNLGGNNPKTAQHYDNKTVVEILHAYNPPTVVRRYAEQVTAIMNAIGPEDITAPVTSNSTT